MDGDQIVDSKVKESVIVFAPVVEGKQSSLKRVNDHIASLSREGGRGSRLLHEERVKVWKLALYVDTGDFRPV